MKYLVTHEYPHLDDIAAIWLFKRYVPGFAQARVAFVTLKGHGEASTYKNKPVDSDPNVVHVGVGRGRFDEHKGDVGKCATLLVHEMLVAKRFIPKSDRAAIAELVHFINLQDTGQLANLQYRNMYLPSLLRGIMDSKRRTKVGEEMLNLAFERYRETVEMDAIIKKGVVVHTSWGDGIAVTTDVTGPEMGAYAAGYTFLIHIDPKREWRSVRAQADSKVDLKPAYDIVTKLEPKAGWYLHQSHKMMMCGSRSAPSVVMSKLPMKKLIEIVQHVAPRAN